MADIGDTKKQQDWKLPGFYSVVEITGAVVPLVVAACVVLFPDSFRFLVHLNAFIYILIGLSVAHIIILSLSHIVHGYRKQLYTVHRWVWLTFWVGSIYITGGYDTHFLFVLIFPLLVTASDLDVPAMRHASILMCVAFALAIFISPEALKSPSPLIFHALRVMLFSVITYYLYTIVKETIRHKFEKEEVKQRFIELFELDKVKSSFVEVASHQLRGPLSGARWGLSSMLEGEKKLPADDIKFLYEIRSQVERAIGIVNEMLQTAEYVAPNLKMTRVEVNIGGLVSSVIIELKHLVERKGVKIVYVPPTDGVTVEGDPRLLHAAISSIIDNAIRYSPNGEVNIEVAKDDKLAMLVVRDNGIGIDESDIPRVSERFFRGKAAINLEPNESGIGLYIAQKVAELHSGKIAIESELKKGTTTSLFFPQKYIPAELNTPLQKG